jgi:hypothetical protein
MSPFLVDGRDLYRLDQPVSRRDAKGDARDEFCASVLDNTTPKTLSYPVQRTVSSEGSGLG